MGGRELPTPQSLTYAALARAPIWLRAFAMMMRGCTPLA